MKRIIELTKIRYNKGRSYVAAIPREIIDAMKIKGEERAWIYIENGKIVIDINELPKFSRDEQKGRSSR